MEDARQVYGKRTNQMASSGTRTALAADEQAKGATATI
jgi:hypothetical protein